MIDKGTIEIVYRCDMCDAELHTLTLNKCDAVGIAHDEGWIETKAGQLCHVCGELYKEAYGDD